MTIELNEKLIIAVKIDCPEEVQRLLVEGGDPNATGKDGASAWDWANIISNSKIIKLLESAGMSYEKEKERKDQNILQVGRDIPFAN